MSALAKPMIHSSRATGSEQPLNAEKIVDFTKITTPKVPNVSGDRYRINFTMEAGTGPKDISWKYKNETDMNDDFAAIVGLISTVTP